MTRIVMRVGSVFTTMIAPCSRLLNGTGTVGMDLQALHSAYAPDERVFLSVAAFYKGKSRSKGWLIPEGKCKKTDT